MSSSIVTAAVVEPLVAEGKAFKTAGLLVLASVAVFLALTGWSVAGVLAIINTVDLSDQAFTNALAGM